MSESLPSQFLSFVQQQQLFQQGDKILLTVSGGADSMLLCHLFYTLKINFGIAHCHFQLRETDADKDDSFVRNYAVEKDIPFHHIRFDTIAYAEQHKLSIEEAARDLRYDWFEKIRKAHGYQYIATGHHQNDNAETLLFHLFRGTGIRGLHGILPKRDKIIRPLLFLSKATILKYMKENKLHYREDKTNQSSDYTRNYIRNDIIPQIEERFPNLISNLGNNIRRFTEAEQLYEKALQEEKKLLIEKKGEEIFIPILKLLKSKPLSTIAFEIFKAYGFSYEQSEQILQLADRSSGKVVYSQTHQLLKDRKWFIISPKAAKENTHFIIEEDTKDIKTNDLTLSFTQQKTEKYILSKDTHIAAFDHQKLSFPLTLRRWKKGDYFYPLGMRKKKKLSRFFIDQKLSLNQKEKVWVLTSGMKIIWIVGKRIDDRFKVTDKTKAILEVKIKQQ